MRMEIGKFYDKMFVNNGENVTVYTVQMNMYTSSANQAIASIVEEEKVVVFLKLKPEFGKQTEAKKRTELAKITDQEWLDSYDFITVPSKNAKYAKQVVARLKVNP